MGMSFYKMVLTKNHKMKHISLFLTLLAVFASLDHLSYLFYEHSLLNISCETVIVLWGLHLSGIVLLEVERAKKLKTEK